MQSHLITDTLEPMSLAYLLHEYNSNVLKDGTLFTKKTQSIIVFFNEVTGRATVCTRSDDRSSYVHFSNHQDAADFLQIK